MTTRITDIPDAPRLRVIAWIPLTLLVAAVLVSVLTSRSVLPTAKAADITVTGSTAVPTVTLDTNACDPNAGAIGEVLPGTTPWKTGQDGPGNPVCTLTFDTSTNVNGVNLVLADAGGAGHALRCISAGCGSARIADYTGTGAEPPVNSSAFGTQLLSSSGVTQVWATDDVHPLLDSNDVACHTTTLGPGSCTFTWGMTAAVSDVPGSYRAQISQLAIAR